MHVFEETLVPKRIYLINEWENTLNPRNSEIFRGNETLLCACSVHCDPFMQSQGESDLAIVHCCGLNR